MRYASTSHEQRTATEPRDSEIESVRLKHIKKVNDAIRLITLESTVRHRIIKFLPGQWLDVFLPGLNKAGGFTITSTPRDAQSNGGHQGVLELAVQNTRNAPAQWLWRPSQEILDQVLRVRVGGSFTWPPRDMDTAAIERLVLVAGGVGINPLISILSHLMQRSAQERPKQIIFLYSTKTSGPVIDTESILFLPRLQEFMANAIGLDVRLFLSGVSAQDVAEAENLPRASRASRIQLDDLKEALGETESRHNTLCYVCGPQKMTDTFVEFLAKQDGMDSSRVLCEKWW